MLCRGEGRSAGEFGDIMKVIGKTEVDERVCGDEQAYGTILRFEEEEGCGMSRHRCGASFGGGEADCESC